MKHFLSIHFPQPIALAAALSIVSLAQAQTQKQTPLSTETPATAFTASSTGPVAQLAEVTVTGMPMGVADMAAPASVLDGEVWTLRRAATLGESLSGEPGIQATHFGAGASRPIIRGMDGPRIGVLANGMELHDASTISPDHAVTTEPLLATQVEILRGPAALVHGGAVGGVVNVVDQKIPTAVPANGIQGSAEVRLGTAASERAGVFGLTGGQGPLAVRIEAASRRAGDYRVGSGWRNDHQEALGRKVPGSFSDTDTGSLGLSWIGRDGYLGLAYTRQQAEYGLPGHSHDYEGCHTHGQGARMHLHCGHHGHTHDDHGHDHHDHDHDHGVPFVDMTSHRWDLRGEWRVPAAGIEAVRLRASRTRYGHDEIEGDAVATRFRNRAHDMRLELQHAPLAGWRGVWGISSGQREFSANGVEAYVLPTDTSKMGVFALEEYTQGDWRWQAALRHDRQTVKALERHEQRKHNGTSLSLGTVWRFMPGYQASASLSRAQRLPSAEELYAQGLHMATGTYEMGNSGLKHETSQALELGLHKTTGATTWSANLYHHRIQGYIYGHVLDVEDSTGLQLLQYSQRNARFTGIEAQVRQRLNRHLALSLWGDVVRAKLVDGGNLPRIPAARLGIRLDANWQGWESMVEWVQVAHQSRTATYETRTPGYGMLNMSVHKAISGTPWQVYVKGENLNNRLGLAHTSFIKHAAPLKGRNLTVGVRMDF